MIKMLFWNTLQRRLRSLWRLVLQFGLMIVLLVLASFLPLGGEDKLLGNTVPLGIAMVGSVCLAGRFLDRRPFSDFGLRIGRDWWIDLCFGLVLGAGLQMAIFAVQLAAGWIEITATWHVNSPGLSFGAAMAYALIDCILVGFYEELFSRGYQLKNLSEGMRGVLGSRGAVIVSVLLSSAVFGLMHLLNEHASALGTFNIFVAGTFLAVGYALTGELAIPIGIHIAWNFFQGSVFGFPVSGYQHPASIISVRPVGEPLVTGGAFGPEAGLIGLWACMLGIYVIIAWVRMRYTTACTRPHVAEAPGDRVEAESATVAGGRLAAETPVAK
jgi:membrane protease YdiL (CAAX protease family)